jgi:hypothetical protein
VRDAAHPLFLPVVNRDVDRAVIIKPLIAFTFVVCYHLKPEASAFFVNKSVDSFLINFLWFDSISVGGVEQPAEQVSA